MLRTVDPNVLPLAEFTHTCVSLTCDFDASTSSDEDGSVASYGWDFGDTGTDTGVAPSHTFADDGDYDGSADGHR